MAADSKNDLPKADLTPDSLLRERELLSFVPISHSTLWREVRSGRFPQPIRLTARTTAWRWAEVVEWLESRRQAA